jgi:hypothetical protein
VSGGFLVLRRGGATWAVAQPAVQGLARRGAGYEVKVAAGALTADEVLGVTTDLLVHPAGGVLRRFWPEAACGLAVHDALPLVLIDPLAPPRSLLGEVAELGEPPGAEAPRSGSPSGVQAAPQPEKGDSSNGN